jgi:hypothetical protein
LAPLGESSGAVQLEIRSGAEASFRVEKVEDRGVDGGDFLQTSQPSEALHCPLPSSKWQMRILGTIVQPATCFLSVCVADFLHRSTIRAEFVGYDFLRLTVSPH